MTPAPSKPRASVLRAFLSGEATGGLALMAAALAALIMANSALAPGYFRVLETYVAGLSVLHWINDALMAVFFLLVGLEIKRELVDGQLSSWPRRALPGIAAAGGMIAPAIVYLTFNAGSPETWRGWAIPSATDIAFALGVLAFLGRRAPVSLKIFLTAVAIIDDLGAVAIIAAFYTADLSLTYLAASLAAIGLLAAFNRAGVARLSPYLLVGALLWFLVLKSGVHATLAGVALAFTIPLKPSPGRPDDAESPLHRLEHLLHPWVTYLVVPVFGFANAGVALTGMTLAQFQQPVTLGIAAGLFAGKQLGVFASVWLTVKLGLGERPAHASWLQIYGISLLCGIGFTMSLFIGLLAFPASPALQDAVKVGVLAGSLASGLAGAIVLAFAGRTRGAPRDS
jgi:NhaA family Na+:H+ antiporter